MLAAMVSASASSAAASSPADSLQSLVDAAEPGSVVNVPAGVYRETVTINKPLTLDGHNAAEIRGSDVWSGWRQSGNLWVSDLTVPALPVNPNHDKRCGEPTNRCILPQQVFVDGQPLRPLNAGENPGPGQFALDAARHVLLADNPNGHTVEVTTRQHWILTQSDDVTIQNMTMRDAANDAQTGGVSNDTHSNWTIRDSVLSNAHGAVVNMEQGSNVRILGNDISRGGDMGIHATKVQSGLVQGNHLHDNATDQFSQTWGAGGLKAAESRQLVVDDNEVDSNAAVGLWCDVKCSNVTFSNNRVHDNLAQGIVFEVSDGAKIIGNNVWNNGWSAPTWGLGAGILVSSSADVDISGNTVAWNKAGISIVEQARPDRIPVHNVDVQDNTIFKNVTPGDYWENVSLAWLSDGTSAMYDRASNNVASGNSLWYDQPESDAVRVTWQQQYAHLADSAATPVGQGVRYLTDSEKTQVLSAEAMPDGAGPQQAHAPQN